MTLNKAYAAGASSTTDAFASGGNLPPPVANIDKFPFAISSGSSTDIGNLSAARFGAAGASSTTEAFASGGNAPPGAPSFVATIDKFPFSQTSGTATTVGNLTSAKYYQGSHQD